MTPPMTPADAGNLSPPPLIDLELQKEVFISEIGNAPPSSAADLRSFFIAVHRFCVRWLQLNGETLDAGASAFVLSKRLEVDPIYAAHDSEFVRLPRLDKDPPSTIAGPIRLVSSNLRMGFARGVADPTVSGIVAELNALGLGDRPTAIFVPGERALNFYLCGVEAGRSFASEPEMIRDLDHSDPLSVIEHFHENYTRFPDGYGNCWHSATNRIVIKNAENAIRNHLFTFLAFAVFRTDYIVREHQLPNGRVDIFIFGYALNDPEAHRVLELKVLRSRSSSWKLGDKERTRSRAVNQAYAQKGVRQAQRYQTASHAIEAYLLCFDAQLEDENLDVDTYATERNVIYRRFFMESTTKEQ